MKISADIFFKTITNSRCFKHESLIMSHKLTTKGWCIIFSLAFLTSCASAKYETVPLSSAPAQQFPAETGIERPLGKKPVFKPAIPSYRKEQPTSGFQELKGERKHITASWYGPDFHGKPTACGELFNMHALTCAHKEYPFGTKLRVVNSMNSKEVECIVTDRGPFIAGRDLDLSYAAAKRIDLVGPGTSKVMIEPLGRDLRYVKYIRYGVSNGVLTIQVGSFKDESNAKRLRMALELRYKNAYIMEANVGGSKYYRVRIGKYNSKGDASKIGTALADEGYNVLITKFEQQL